VCGHFGHIDYIAQVLLSFLVGRVQGCKCQLDVRSFTEFIDFVEGMRVQPRLGKYRIESKSILANFLGQLIILCVELGGDEFCVWFVVLGPQLSHQTQVVLQVLTHLRIVLNHGDVVFVQDVLISYSTQFQESWRVDRTR